MDFHVVVQKNEIGVGAEVECPLAAGDAEAVRWMQRRSFQSVLNRAVCFSLESSHAFVHRRDGAAQRVRPSDVRLVVPDLDRVLSNPVHPLLESHSRYRVSHQDEPARVRPVSDPERCSVRVNPIGDDAEVNDFAVGDLVGCEKANEPRVAVMELQVEEVNNLRSARASTTYRQHGIKQMCNQCGSMLHSSFSVLQICRRVPDGNGDISLHELVDGFRRLLLLRRQGNDGDVAYVAVNFLNCLEALVELSDAVCGMGAFLIN